MPFLPIITAIGSIITALNSGKSAPAPPTPAAPVFSGNAGAPQQGPTPLELLQQQMQQGGFRG